MVEIEIALRVGFETEQYRTQLRQRANVGTPATRSDFGQAIRSQQRLPGHDFRPLFGRSDNAKATGREPAIVRLNGRYVLLVIFFRQIRVLNAPTQAVSSFMNMTARMVRFGLMPSAFMIRSTSMDCTQPAPSSWAPSARSHESRWPQRR